MNNRSNTVMMESARTLKTISRNMMVLYVQRRYEDLLTYTKVINQDLNRHDLAAVKQSFQSQVNTRGMK